MHMSVKQTAEKWGISDRRVRTLCAEGKVPGVIREGRSYRIHPRTDVINLPKTFLKESTGRKQNWTPGGH